jgi:hypothetical protein
LSGLQHAVVSLNGLSPQWNNPHCGFELMNGAALSDRRKMRFPVVAPLTLSARSRTAHSAFW